MALDLNGTDQRIAIPALPASYATFSVTAWAYRHTNTQANQSVLGHGSTAVNSRQFSCSMMYYDFGDGLGTILRIYQYLCDDAVVLRNYAGRTSLSLNTWYHLTWVRNTSADERLYVNGALETLTYQTTGAFGALTTNTSYLGCLRRSAYINPFDGLLFDVRTYSVALTAGQVATIYNARGADDVVANLTARWLLNDGPDGATTPASCKDWTGAGGHGTPENTPVYRAAPMRTLRAPISIG